MGRFQLLDTIPFPFVCSVKYQYFIRYSIFRSTVTCIAQTRARDRLCGVPDRVHACVASRYSIPKQYLYFIKLLYLYVASTDRYFVYNIFCTTYIFYLLVLDVLVQIYLHQYLFSRYVKFYYPRLYSSTGQAVSISLAYIKLFIYYLFT